MECKPLYAEIIPGAKATVNIDLTDGEGKPLDLSTYTAIRAVFCNCAGTRIIVTVPLPTEPILGSLTFDIPSTDTALFDKKSVNFDLEFDAGASVNDLIVPINDKIKLTPRNCPPV